MSLWNEIRRRNVHRVAIAYAAVAWLLIQIAETLFPVFGLSDMAVRTVVIVIAIGFVPAVILSWVFEWTAEGFRRDSDVTAPPPAERTRRFDAAIIAMLVLAMAYFAVDKFVLDPSRDAAEREAARQEGRADALVESFGDKSIVVLPFVNISSDPEQDYLGDGLAEELLNLLARVEGLRVISRTSAFSFKGTEITTAEIARQLNVSYVLEGSVRKSGDALRITAQLIDGRADSHVWSDTYDHSSEDIFDIQDSVAAKVVGQLKTELSFDLPKVDRHHPVAYTLYLQARQLSSRAGTGDTQRELLIRALELEPDFLDAKVSLAWAHRRIARGLWEAGDIEAAEWHEEQYSLIIDDVLVQDPWHTRANASRAWENLYVSFPRAAMYAERALESEPTDPNALTTAGELLVRLWRAEQAIPILRYASERDPLNANHFQNLAGAYLDAGQYESAEEAFRTDLVLEPGYNDWTRWGIGLALLLQGKESEALQHFDESLEDDHPLRWHGNVLALHDLDRADDALAELAQLLEADPELPNIYWVIGTAYAWIGATDEAFDFFEKQQEEDNGIFINMGESPLYVNLRDDPRWRPFLASVELDPNFLASVEFNPRLPSEIRLQENTATR